MFRDRLSGRSPLRGAGLAAVVVAVMSVAAAERAATRAGESVTDAAPFDPAQPILMFTPENLTPRGAPIDWLERSLADRLSLRGIRLVPSDDRDAFFRRERVRYMGGITGPLGETIRETLGVPAILITSVAAFDDDLPPRVSVVARLVSTESEPRILWMDGSTVSGNDAPRILGIGRVDDVGTLLDRTTDDLATSLSTWMRTGAAPAMPKSGGKYEPRRSFRSPVRTDRPRDHLRVAVLPFTNRADRRHAGSLIALQFTRFLQGKEGLTVVEPGVVRNALLRARLIPEGGISFPQSEILRVLLDVDVVVAGEILTYGERVGARRVPAVDFAAQAIDTSQRQVVWSSISYNTGSDGVFFFGVGRKGTAQALTDRMVWGTVRRMLTERERARERS